MNLSFVEAFYWAATLKNVTLAAKKLFLTQAAVSARIARLEEELQVPLLDRRVRHVQLTSAGARFLVDADRLLASWNEIKTRFGSSSQRAVSLRLGANESVLHSWLIPWLERLRGEQPGLELELTIETTPMLLELMRRGSVQLIMAVLPLQADGVLSRALPSLPMVFVGNRELHKRRKYTLEQLAQYELLTFQRGSQPHMALLDLLKGAGLEDARVHNISSSSAMVRLVAAGFGVATLPHAIIERSPAMEGLRVLPCETELVPQPLQVSWRADPTSDVVDAIVDSAVAFAGSHESNPLRHRKIR
jgi:DNA-binding transcriptional LysR family regulator